MGEDGGSGRGWRGGAALRAQPSRKPSVPRASSSLGEAGCPATWNGKLTLLGSAGDADRSPVGGLRWAVPTTPPQSGQALG